MLMIDKRAGSEKLLAYGPNGDCYLVGTQIKVQPTILRAGDIELLGNGPGGTFVSIGVEYKTVGDLLKCMCDGRLSGTQLPAMEAEGYQQRWLLIEGAWRGNPTTGVLEQIWFNPYSSRWQWIESSLGSRRFMPLEFNSWLMTIEMMGGMRIARTLELSGTVQWIEALNSWWTKKQWEDHRAHLHPDNSGEPTRLLGDHVTLTQTGRSKLLCERGAAQIEGIGWDRGKNVAMEFGTLKRMVEATHKDWLGVAGIGKVLSKRAMKDIGWEMVEDKK